MKILFKINCMYCNKYYENATAFSLHLKIHNITSHEYYDKYLKKPNEGICKICNKPTKLYSITVGYRPYCSIRCKNNDKNLMLRIKETNNKIYGGTGFASKELNNKCKETCFELYGDRNYNNKEKAVETNLKKYGVVNPIQLPEVRKKIEETNLHKYGVRYFTNPEKGKQTKKEKYNDANYNNIEKIKQTNLNKYGKECILHIPQFEEKIRKIIRERYGVDYPTQNKDIIKKCINTYRINEHIYKRINRKSCYFYNNTYFDSCPELAYYIWLIDNKIDFEYHPNTRFEYYFQGNLHYYYPDFRVNNDYHEIKGLHFFKEHNPLNEMYNPFDKNDNGKTEAKHQCMIRNNVKIITDFKIFFEHVHNKYSKTYLSNFKT